MKLEPSQSYHLSKDHQLLGKPFTYRLSDALSYNQTTIAHNSHCLSNCDSRMLTSHFGELEVRAVGKTKQERLAVFLCSPSLEIAKLSEALKDIRVLP